MVNVEAILSGEKTLLPVEQSLDELDLHLSRFKASDSIGDEAR